MAKIRLTKNELKKQKDQLARFTRYLPTLELKKAQLISEVRRINDEITEIQTQIETAEKRISPWVDVFGEPIDLNQMLSVEDILTETGNIAGIDIPLFDQVVYKEQEYDLMATPLWVDIALEEVKKQVNLKIKTSILQKQIDALQKELQITVQRINLFDKIKIPEAKAAIKKIRIYLGDVQTAEVVRGKISKKKIENKKEKADA
ncbi:MAG: V-type ATP synthase subunit D [Candidatus Marinimicrobia bacterium]|nr:V-type ATP synthase subunit D [Candidatus Neomarinimicrobiota bacterium]